MKISVVLSFRNEEDVIQELTRRLIASIKKNWQYELIFINDASTDRSLAILKKLAEGNNKIKILTMSRRFGVSPCVIAGFEAASGDAVVYMDADLQDPPELIPVLVDKFLAEKADVVYTTRTVRRGENPIKMLITKIAYRMIGAVSEIKPPLDSGDFKLLSRRAVNHLLSLPERELYLRGLVSWIGFKQVAVPYERDPRFAGQTKFSLFRSLNPYKTFVQGVISFSTAPLFIALLLGALLLFLSGGYLLAGFIMPLFGAALPGFNLIAGSIFFIGSIQLFSIGIASIYIAAMFHEVKARPRFIIESSINYPSRKNT